MANSLANIPILDAVHPGTVENAAAGISKAGTGIQQAGDDVASAWSKLHGVDKTPEVGELIGAVRDQTERFGWEAGQVGAALSDYAAEIAPVKAKLTALKTAAGVMLMAQAATDGGEDHWRREQSNVDAENKLLHDVAVAVNEGYRIAAKCANRINGLTGSMQVHGGVVPVGNPDAYGSNGPFRLSWADPVKKDDPWWKDGLNRALGFGEGVVDSASGAVKGVGPMAGFGLNDCDWHNVWDSYKEIETAGPGPVVSWALGLSSVRKVDLDLGLGKDFVAWDEWKMDKGRAAGKAGANVITLGAPEARTGAAGKAGDVALVNTKGANKVDVVSRDLDKIPDTSAPKSASAHFDLDDMIIVVPNVSHPPVHAMPDAKPTVAPVADDVKSKISHDAEHPSAPEDTSTPAGGKRPRPAGGFLVPPVIGGHLPAPMYDPPSVPYDPPSMSYELPSWPYGLGAGGSQVSPVTGFHPHAGAHDPLFVPHDPAAGTHAPTIEDENGAPDSATPK